MQAEGLWVFWGLFEIACAAYEGGSNLRPPYILLGLEIHNKHVRRLHKLLLHAARRNEDLVAMLDARAAAGACYLVNYSC